LGKILKERFGDEIVDIQCAEDLVLAAPPDIPKALPSIPNDTAKFVAQVECGPVAEDQVEVRTR
jgi:hypothetical protein